MIDLNAPIVPGKEIGKIRLGERIENVVRNSKLIFEVKQTAHDLRHVRYVAEHIVFWVNDGLITQIMARNQYAGTVFNKVGIGTSLHEVRALLGRVILDKEDNLVIEGIRGLCFEIDVESQISPVTEIYVYEVEQGE